MGKAYSGRLIFDHLPKTAGQSINAWLVDALGSGVVSPNLIFDHRSGIRRFGGQYSVICGHIRFEDGFGLDPRYQYITCLREPVDRCLSMLYFLANNQSENDFLKSEALAFIESEGDYKSHVLVNELSNVYVDHFCSIGGERSRSNPVEQALRALWRYDVVGNFDNLPAFMQGISQLTGLAAAPLLFRKNVTIGRLKPNEVPTALRQKLVELNNLDLPMYETAVGRLGTSGIFLNLHTQFNSRPWEKYDRLPPRAVQTDVAAIERISIREGASVQRGQRLTFDVDVSTPRGMDQFTACIHIQDSLGEWAYITNSKLLGLTLGSVRAGFSRLSFQLVIDLRAGQYTVGFAVIDESHGGSNIAVWRDEACSFTVIEPGRVICSGYMPLASTISLLSDEESCVGLRFKSYSGHLSLETDLLDMLALSEHRVRVKITNDSMVPWIFDELTPIRASYHWLSLANQDIEFDGLRTELPRPFIRAGETLSAEMTVRAPEQPGSYKLMLTVVHERICWAEMEGFKSHIVEVKVLEKSKVPTAIPMG